MTIVMILETVAYIIALIMYLLGSVTVGELLTMVLILLVSVEIRIRL